MKLQLKTRLDQMGVIIKDITEGMAKDLYQAVAQLALMTYNKAVEMAGQRLNKQRQDYINALHLESQGAGIFVVYLDEEANYIEDGRDTPFPMLPKLLAGPKAKISKAGLRYNIIPLRHATTASEKASTKSQDLAANLRQIIQERKFKRVKAGLSPKTGKYTTVERLTDKDVHPHLKGLVRVREYKSQGAKRPISSMYYTFRTASEKQDPATKWVQPPRKGAHIFPELEQWADKQLSVIIEEYFGTK